MAREEEKPVLQGTFTAEDFANLFKSMSASQMDAMKVFASELATKISHPDPTPVERQATLANLAARSEQARQNEETKAYKRAHCVPPAQSNMPHQRSGQQWGFHNGSSTIAWMYTNPTVRTVLGSREGSTVAMGVCQWCFTEFKPGDADYDWALRLGTTQSIGSYPMNQNTGVWQNA